MAGQLNDSDDVVANINVTPFVDVVLVLLVILMVTSTDLVRAQLGIELPSAASAGEAVPTTVNVVVKSDGSLWLDGRGTTEEALAAAVRGASVDAGDGAVQAVVSADKGADYGAVIRVVDIVKQNGVRNFALSVEKAAGGR